METNEEKKGKVSESRKYPSLECYYWITKQLFATWWIIKQALLTIMYMMWAFLF